MFTWPWAICYPIKTHYYEEEMTQGITITFSFCESIKPFMASINDCHLQIGKFHRAWLNMNISQLKDEVAGTRVLWPEDKVGAKLLMRGENGVKTRWVNCAEPRCRHTNSTWAAPPTTQAGIFKEASATAKEFFYALTHTRWEIIWYCQTNWRIIHL